MSEHDNEERFCRDCKYFQFYVSFKDSKCHHDVRGPRDIVSGVQKVHYHLCSIERLTNSTLFNRLKCGPSGRYFEEGDLYSDAPTEAKDTPITSPSPRN